MIQLQPIYFGLFLIILLFSKDFDGAAGRQPPPCYKPYDVTLLDCKNGSDVVDAVFAKLDCLQVFNGSDHILMRRIACEETKYGESENYTCDESGGGIWRLERELFDKLIEPHVQNMLRNVSDIIKNRSGFSFSKAKQYTFLTKPFYSGLAARLYLHYLEITGVSVPFNGSTEEQADFWINNYHLDRTTEETTADCFNRSRGRTSKLGCHLYGLVPNETETTPLNQLCLELPNGLVCYNGHLPGAVAVYVCNKDYILHGDSTRECGQDGLWSGQVPQCQFHLNSTSTPTMLGCHLYGLVPNETETTSLNQLCLELPNGLVCYNGHLPGAVAVYVCNKDYILHGDSTRECGQDGLWSGQVPQCQFHLNSTSTPTTLVPGAGSGDDEDINLPVSTMAAIVIITSIASCISCVAGAICHRILCSSCRTGAKKRHTSPQQNYDEVTFNTHALSAPLLSGQVHRAADPSSGTSHIMHMADMKMCANESYRHVNHTA